MQWMGRQYRVDLESTILGVDCRQLNKLSPPLIGTLVFKCYIFIIYIIQYKEKQQKRHLHLIRIIGEEQDVAPRGEVHEALHQQPVGGRSQRQDLRHPQPCHRGGDLPGALCLYNISVTSPLGGGGGQGGRGHRCEGRQVAWRQGHVTTMLTSHWTGRPSSWALSGGRWMLPGEVR